MALLERLGKISLGIEAKNFFIISVRFKTQSVLKHRAGETQPEAPIAAPAGAGCGGPFQIRHSPPP